MRLPIFMTLVMVLLLSGSRLAAQPADPVRSPKQQPIGWLGISIQEVGEELAERLAATFGVESGTGVLVIETVRGGPAESGGLKPNDVIVKLENQPIWEVRQLQKIIRQSAPGRQVWLTVFRGEQRVQVLVTVGQMPEAMRGQVVGERLGFLARFLAVGAQEKEIAGRPAGEVLLVFVEPGSPAAEAGLRAQDRLLRIGEHEIRSLEEMATALRVVRAGERLSVQIVRDGKIHTFLLQVPPPDDVTETR